MNKKHRNTIKIWSIVFVSTLIVIFFIADTAYAQLTTPTSIPEYVRNIYVAGLMLVGVAAFLMLIYGGYLYMAGGVNASMISNAKTVITNALLGLVLLICSVLILRTINPQLISLTWNVWNLPPVDQLETDFQNGQSGRTTLDKSMNDFLYCSCKCWGDSMAGANWDGTVVNHTKCGWKANDYACHGRVKDKAACDALCETRYPEGNYEVLLSDNYTCCCGVTNSGFNPTSCRLKCQQNNSGD